MLSSTQIGSKCLRHRSALTALLVLGGCLAIACSSGDTTPTNPVGGAGTTTTAGAGTSSTTTAGTAGAGGSGVGTAGSVATSGGGQGGSTSTGGGGSASVGGGGGGTGGSGGAAGGSTGGGGTGGGASGAGGVNNGPFALKSSAFMEGQQIPLMYKCANVNPKGQNISPPLSWGPGPTGTKSYAVVLMHLDTPEHWVIWDIPASVTSLPENIEHAAQPAAPAGSKQSLANLDGFQGSGYLGPCPQMPNSVQSYRFTLYALDVETVPGLTATSSPGAAAAAVKMHLVQGSQGVSLTGTQIQIP
jgi:Raf kinase inhibitor-like YbhB/YbcL family protein